MELQLWSPLLLILCPLESSDTQKTQGGRGGGAHHGCTEDEHICLCLSLMEEERQHWGLESPKVKAGLEPISCLVCKPEGQLSGGAGEIPIERKSSLRKLRPLGYGSLESLRNESLHG